jgi:integrase
MRIKIGKKDTFLSQKQFLSLVNDFIEDTYTGRRLKQNGAPISQNTVKNYESLFKALFRFADQSSFELKIYIENNLTQRQREKVKRYYQKFYKSFTNYMYDELGYFDNYVGSVIKVLKVFFNYLNNDKCISIGQFYKYFYVPNEEIPIITLNREQLKYMITNKVLIQNVRRCNLEKVRDIFIFGCTVALRVSDLLNLKPNNLIVKNGNHYLLVKSKKTKRHTSIKLPQYCVDILHKYHGQYNTLLPNSSAAWFNTNLKKLAKLIPDDFELIKTREKRGKEFIIYKDKKQKLHFSTHTMRRTAITTMLNLGMPEHMVRKISGHAPNSKEFFRYVQLSQSFMDEETDKVFNKLIAK